MPSLSRTFLSLLHEDYSSYKCFIETGTLNGETTFALEPHFDRLYTIEFSEKYYTRTKARYSGKKIQFIHGDSGIVFGSLLPTIHERCIFFLDGHWSSGDTGRSAKDCPLVEEITHIANLFAHEAILIVDDFRMFGTSLAEDWSEIHKDRLLAILGSRVKEVYHLDSESAKDDRLVIHITQK